MSDFVRLKNVSKSYVRGAQNVEVLRRLDVAIAKEEFVSLMGPSGSGKTTLLNLIAGLDQPTTGEVIVNGSTLHQMSEAALSRWRARNVGFVFQFYNLLPTLTAERNVELPLFLTNLSSAKRKENVALALKLVGLEDRAKHKPNELSGGQQQRVSIARALISDASLLVCDEPTGDLDRDSATEILELLRALNKQHGKTIVMVTHDPVAASYATRQLQMDKGVMFERSMRHVA